MQLKAMGDHPKGSVSKTCILAADHALLGRSPEKPTDLSIMAVTIITRSVPESKHPRI